MNETVSEAVDCTACGNCCKTLMINVEPNEVEALAVFLEQPVDKVKEQYIEESLSGKCIINSIPCGFLKGTKCSIYSNRFQECRDFPHLHKPGFSHRLPATLQYFGTCPIIYNVIEFVKRETGFIQKNSITDQPDF